MNDEVLSKMNDGANKPSRSPCPVRECSRTLFSGGLDCFQPAPLIQSRLDPLPNFIRSSECTAITHQRGVFSVQHHHGVYVLRVVRSEEFLSDLCPRSGLEITFGSPCRAHVFKPNISNSVPTTFFIFSSPMPLDPSGDYNRPLINDC